MFGFTGKTDGFGRKINAALGADNGADGRCLGSSVGGYHGDVTSHDLNASKLAAKRAVFVKDKALGTDSGKYLLIGNSGSVQDGIFPDIKLLPTDLALKYIDWRSAKESGYKQV